MKLLTFICLSIFFVSLFFAIKNEINEDICLDTGYCAAGLELKVNEKTIIVDKNSCLVNNGIWKQNKKLCVFKY